MALRTLTPHLSPPRTLPERAAHRQRRGCGRCRSRGRKRARPPELAKPRRRGFAQRPQLHCCCWYFNLNELNDGPEDRQVSRFAQFYVTADMDACPRLDYVISIPKNAVLLRHAEPAMTRARARSARSGRTEHVYGETRYAAGSWKQQRRVVIKAEVVRLAGREPRDNPRFVVTNLGRPPRSLYEKVYCARGDIENRIKELLDGLQIDRTSCCRFAANQLRVLLTAAAYVLMQELRLCAARTACARTQVTWLRDRLLKLGVHVVRSVRRVVLHLPRATPYLDAWRRIALALGARTG